MSRPLPMYRNILLSEEINSSSVEKIINAIFSINYDDDQKEAEYKDWEREPIKLFINTNGGNAYDAFALGDVIHKSKTPVHTIALGWCMSAGLWIFMHGHKRLIGEHATLMFHDVATWVVGKTEEVKQDLHEAQRLAKMYCKSITDVSMVKQETLDDYILRKAEWYIPAEEAISNKMATEYFK